MPKLESFMLNGGDIIAKPHTAYTNTYTNTMMRGKSPPSEHILYKYREKTV